MRGAYVEGLFLANLLTEIFTRISLRNYYTISLSLSLSLSLSPLWDGAATSLPRHRHCLTSS
jgi:hypothetical protein